MQFEVMQAVRRRIKKRVHTTAGWEVIDAWQFGNIVRLDSLNPDVVEVMWSDGSLQVVETKNLQAA